MHQARDNEIVHTKFCRWILHVKKSTNLTGLYGELGRVPMIVNRKIIMVKYWLKTLKLEETSIPRKIYLMLKRDADNGISYNGLTWAFHIKTILESLGLSFVWLQQTDINISFDLIKQRILDNYRQN